MKSQFAPMTRRTLLLAGLLLAGLARAADNENGYAVGDMALGPEDATVTIIEYASMTCPHCARFHTDVFGSLKAKYVDTGKVRFVFREFPLDGLAFRASLLARCAGEERFFAMIDVLFSQQASWSRAEQPLAALAKIGKLAGIGQERFDACMKDTTLQNLVLQNRKTAQEKFNVSSTPSFVINGELQRGAHSMAEFDQALGKLLN